VDENKDINLLFMTHNRENCDVSFKNAHILIS
jgi:hypothetical protein